MNFIQRRTNCYAASLFYAARLRRNRFDRLVPYHIPGQRIQIRHKNHQADLRRFYRRNIVYSGCLTLVVMIICSVFYPERELVVAIQPPPAGILQLNDIPETVQKKRAAAMPRPKVPLAVEGEDVPDDVTITSTELAFDDVTIDLPSLSPLAGIGDISTEPMEYDVIDYKPHPTRLVTPQYPVLAYKKRQVGTVWLKVLVDTNGDVEDVQIINGDEIFQKAAFAAAKQFRFRPGKHAGKRRKVWMTMPIEFALR